jgi:hypothetical protein
MVVRHASDAQVRTLRRALAALEQSQDATDPRVMPQAKNRFYVIEELERDGLPVAGGDADAGAGGDRELAEQPRPGGGA